ncbi:hypothetical protein FA10DRAFT_242021 [Acaromyces ingoldii]|uniref:Ribosome assembly factor mrt4 n=1 Tax=Acaromyces ingoldii TaxID=215250 RepID=A0A316YSK7_9BASI|nr:hypothetical protein FA10DRAFT_242021 [Acaromyces ingoldii]PWN90993.1 hypothetical protein FA10DRAFT_242021 [Acaromyces ingoldii]
MPRAKRNKVVALTRVPKRNTRDRKASHMDVVREAAQAHPTVVLFGCRNMRAAHLHEVRALWKSNGSQIIYGKNRVVARALGATPEEELRTGLSGLTARLNGSVGLLFTDSARDEVLDWCKDHEREDFARSGHTATQDVLLPAGPVQMALDPPETLPAPLEPQLRKLGMPTELKRGVPTLLQPYQVSTAGQKLSPENAQILKHLMIKDAKFRLVPLAVWEAATERVDDLALSDEDRKEFVRAKKKKRASAAAAQRGEGKNGAALDEDEDDEEMSEDDDDEDAEDDDDEDGAEVDEFEAGDKVGKDMMLPAGL